jgi:hypothetical protein
LSDAKSLIGTEVLILTPLKIVLITAEIFIKIMMKTERLIGVVRQGNKTNILLLIS